MTLAHQAFLYDSPGNFVAGMAPVIRAGLKRGDTVFAAAKPANLDALREELGDDATHVDLQDTGAWKTRPYDRLQAFQSLIDGLPHGGSLCALGEPVWEGSDAAIRQWARYESIINLALAEAPMRFICLYDSGALPDHILEYASRTHPEHVTDGSTSPSPHYLEPERFVPGPAALPPRDAEELPLDGAALRRRVAERATREGLSRERVAEVVLASSEVATNASRHGLPPVHARIWKEAGELVLHVSDSGFTPIDPLAGWLPPHAPLSDGGWGLMVARQICDAVEITASETGTSVSLHFRA